jgi:hypothetical protein
LSRYELETIRKALVSRRLIEEKLCGVPAKLYYRINWDELSIGLAEAIETHTERVNKRGAPTNRFKPKESFAGKPGASPPPGGGIAANKLAEAPQSIRSESTTENTKRRRRRGARAKPIRNSTVKWPSRIRRRRFFWICRE